MELIHNRSTMPDMIGLQHIKGQRDRGVKIEIFTNSLASNDVKAAHGGYANYRKEMLRLTLSFSK